MKSKASQFVASSHGRAGKFRSTKGNLPEINVAIQHLPTVTAKAWQALKHGNKPPYMFRRGDILVRIEPDENSCPCVKPLNDSRLRYEMARKAKWYRRKKDKFFDAMPPMAVIKDMLATPNPPVPVLARIVEVPVYGSNWGLRTEKGYHKESRTLYEPSRGFTFRAASLEPTREKSKALNKSSQTNCSPIFLLRIRVTVPMQFPYSRSHMSVTSSMDQHQIILSSRLLLEAAKDFSYMRCLNLR